MASMICNCGNRLSNHEIPNDIQLIVYTDKEWDMITSYEEIKPWMIPRPTYDVWRCPDCGRIYVFDDNYNGPIYIYKLEK